MKSQRGWRAFNTQFNFDYDNSDGVDSQTIDFETAALHELAHVLGFVSHLGFVEVVLQDNLDEPVRTSTLDLFRFASNTRGGPAGPDEFRLAPRSLRPGEEAVLDFLVHGQYPVSTGVKEATGRMTSSRGLGLALWIRRLPRAR